MPNSGSRRPTSDAANALSAPSQHGAAEIDLRAPSRSAPEHASKSPSTNLVLPRSLLIGRDREIAAVQNLLLQEQVGLLTLTAPGFPSPGIQAAGAERWDVSSSSYRFGRAGALEYGFRLGNRQLLLPRQQQLAGLAS
jgi:hypothetical protein